MQKSIFDYMIELEVHRELLRRDSVWARSADPFRPFLRSIYTKVVARLGALLVRWGNSMQTLDQPLSGIVGD